MGGLVPAVIGPFGVEETVFVHQAHFGVRAAFTSLRAASTANSIASDLLLVRTELFVGELDLPRVVNLKQKVSCRRHRLLPFPRATMGTQYAIEVWFNAIYRGKFGAGTSFREAGPATPA